MSKRHKKRRANGNFDQLADDIAVWFAGKERARFWDHQMFGVLRARKDDEGRTLKMGHMDGTTFKHLVEITLTNGENNLKLPITKVVLDDFYYDNKPPAEVKLRFRAAGGPRGLILRGYAFVWYSIGIAARLNGKPFAENVAKLVDGVEIVDSWQSERRFKTVVPELAGMMTKRDKHHVVKMSSAELNKSRALAAIYAQTFGDYAGVSTDDLTTYLHASGIYWPFRHKDAFLKHGFNVGSAASFVDYT